MDVRAGQRLHRDQSCPQFTTDGETADVDYLSAVGDYYVSRHRPL
ncbi:hypothetical protein ACIA98_17825 [Streptomyces sp. NPDC051366]